MFEIGGIRSNNKNVKKTARHVFVASSALCCVVFMAMAFGQSTYLWTNADSTTTYGLHFKPTCNKKNAGFNNSDDWAYMDAYTETSYYNYNYLISIGQPRTVKFHYKGISDFVAPVDPQIAGWKNLAADGYWGNCEPIHGITKVIVEQEVLDSPFTNNPPFTLYFGNIYNSGTGMLQGTATTWNFTVCRGGPNTGDPPFIPTLEYYPTGSVNYFSIVPQKMLAIIDIQIFYTCTSDGTAAANSQGVTAASGDPFTPTTAGSFTPISIPGSSL